jgi:hypothetical protein
VTGYLTSTSIDLSGVAAGTDFVAAIARSEIVVSTVTRAQVTAGLLIAGAGVCFGIIMFGLGVIFNRFNKLTRGSDA